MSTDKLRLTGGEARRLIRSGKWPFPTAGLAAGYVQANLAIVPRSLAQAFESFCHLNPQPLPLLERVADGSPFPQRCTREADLRTDLPKYHVNQYGDMVREPLDLIQEWQDDWCAFLLGCSFTFDALLLEAGIPVRHIEQGCNVPMYKTHRALQPVGPFFGELVVSMRPIPARDIARVVDLTTPLQQAHGAPVHVGAPDVLGILDLACPDYGDAVAVRPGEVPVFWACGVTSQHVAQSCRIPLMVTHAPGHMFITDLRIDDLASEKPWLPQEERSVSCPDV